MVDPIGITGVSGRGLTVSRVAPTAPVAKAATANTAGAADTAALTGLAKTLSAAAPVDTDRVAQVKKAIAEGNFPILPATIADRLIAYKLNWNSND
ncbi:anti-sigma-28 factor, FlgM family [Sphingomonas gellani]|uniref:Negative regulator of flagellin synthesis n=1 Tax=Sphingomonas gellani TaxID=1166340 RepID=A0A1H8CM66_9SPHN|nr:flagellar biosynthesis anti-sigma factor FlgM [Sphingomonas gellani]SEM95378.1 anti-sigma-28 factor, FlgM family [Sphingomonas gellani]